MKRIALIVVMMMLGLTASANSIRFFTFGQAQRTVSYLNTQKEMMIYCGYDYEIETYVLISDVWMERYNSAFYEIWVFGYDAYTGEEIYMPLDLKCVWLFSGSHVYNAAQYLRFHGSYITAPTAWYVPRYNPYTRVVHRPGFRMTYHFAVHQHGWMPSTPLHGYGMTYPLPPYYNRPPHTPAPRPTAPWTPGVNRPTVSSNEGGVRVTTNAPQTGSSHTSGTRTSTTSGRQTGSTGASTGSDRTSGRSCATTPTRNNVSGTATPRSEGTTTSTTSGSRSEATSSTTSGSRSTGTATGARTRSTEKTTGSRSSNTEKATTSRSTESGTATRTGSSSRASEATTTSSRSGNSRSIGTATGTRSGRSTGSSSSTTRTR